MTYRRQKEALQELERIPRGPRGSLQNHLRLRFWPWRMHGDSFEESYAKALAGVRETDPSFEPRVLPPSQDAGQ